MSKTVKVRVPVAVDHEGRYAACRWWNEGREGDWRDFMDVALDELHEGEARYWLTAELPIPEVEVEAEVEKA